MLAPLGPWLFATHAAVEARRLPLVERNEDDLGALRFDAVGDSSAGLVRRRDQRDHPARRPRHAAMVRRSLPEAPGKAGQESTPALQVGERGPEDQRAVGEDPDRVGVHHFAGDSVALGAGVPAFVWVEEGRHATMT